MIVRLAWLAALVLAAAGRAAADCCSTCIAQTTSVAFTYDPVVFDECTSVTGGICCFNCGSLGEPTYGDAVSFENGTTAVAKTGTYIAFTWANVANVTYVALKTGQAKTVTVTLSSTQAKQEDDGFLICPTSAGTIYFRGFGDENCTTSPEKSITIEQGDTTTCDSSSLLTTTTAPSSASASSSGSSDSANLESCNANRGSIKEVDGVKQCVCVSDWTNPPECDQWPAWKWVVTIGGGVAALFSILLSVRAFIKSREKKNGKMDRDSGGDPPMLQKDVETLQITPSRDKYEPLAMPVAYKRDSDIDYIAASGQPTAGAAAAAAEPRKPDHREFAL